MSQFVGCCRYVWNRTLNIQQETLAETGKRLPYATMCRQLTQWKQEPQREWLKDAPIHALQQSLKHLDIAYQRYFDPKLDAEKPQFKKKFKRDSFKESDVSCFQIQGNKIRLPKIGWVKFYKSRDIQGTPRNVTVSRKGKHWFVSIQVQLEVKEPAHPSKSHIGIDMGVKRFATLSDGKVYKPLNSFRKLEDKLAREQRKLSTKVKFSNNWKKQKSKVQQVHIKMANARNDYLQKASTTISKNHAMVVMEELKVANMSKSAKGTKKQPGKNVKAKSGLNKSVLDQGWYAFRLMVDYKQHWRGGKVRLVPPQYTSQRCFQCGHTCRENRTNQAAFRCVSCGYSAHADLVASKNILAAGQAASACGS